MHKRKGGVEPTYFLQAKCSTKEKKESECTRTLRGYQSPKATTFYLIPLTPIANSVLKTPTGHTPRH